MELSKRGVRRKGCQEVAQAGSGKPNSSSVFLAKLKKVAQADLTHQSAHLWKAGKSRLRGANSSSEDELISYSKLWILSLYIRAHG